MHPFSPEARADPAAVYRRLAEHDPLYRDPSTDAVLLTRHGDCDALLRDRRTSTAQSRRSARLPPSMLTTDPPEHIRLRGFGAALVSLAAVDRVRAVLEADVDAILAAVEGQEVIEAVEAIATPFAATVLCRVLDIPLADRGLVTQLARACADTLDPRGGGGGGERATAALAFYLRSRVQVSPHLQRWQQEAGCDDGEATGVLSLCVIGGFDPLVAAAASTLHRLGADPTLRDAVRAGHVATAVEELLRMDTPIPFVARSLPVALDLPSGTVEEGIVLAVVAAANRDQTVFGDDVDWARSPSRTLTFGAGAHFCLGAALVRASLSTLLVRAAERLPEVRSIDESLDWAPSLVPRRLASLHLVVSSAPPPRIPAP